MKENKESKGFMTGIILLVTLVGVTVLIFAGNRDSGTTVSDSGIKISGIYGLTIGWNEITDVTLIESSMKTIGAGRRVNGFGGLGRGLKGHFVSDSGEKMILHVNQDAAPVIHIKRANDADVYISFKDSDKTRRLYDDIAARLG